ncbi:chymotrypsinogen A-like [Clytia hemisphaerica]|uniref:chymotrypsinogen A-like n=1 Tax=Clytia hemisphaerica TaxID=252671 RepID=UPI0034D6A09D
MIRIFLLVVFIVIASDIQGRVLEKRIIHGTEAKPGAWPWIVYIETKNRSCGGTILSPTWIMTASHCIDDNPTSITVVAGAHNIMAMEDSQQEKWAKRYILHPNYRKGSFESDIALIELWTPFVFNDRVNRSLLPGCNDYPLVGTWCYIAGWGRTQYDPVILPDKLQQALIPIRQQNEKDEHILVGFGVQGKGKGNACRGDSGGPLMCKSASGHWIVEGASSWGYKECHSVSGYTPLTKYLNWVKQYAPV